ncbi:MAG: hypothetical protein AAB631_01825 [Patescibacteria group bacterium]
MSKKEIVLIIVAVIIVVAGIWFLTAQKSMVRSPVPSVPDVNPVPVSIVPPKYFKPEIPFGASPSKAAVEVPATLNSDRKLKMFDLTVSAAGYAPATLTAKKGDLVQIRMTAVGGDFDFTAPYLGLYQSARAGETKPIGFTVDFTGTADFMCRDFCPTGKQLKGVFVALP